MMRKVKIRKYSPLWYIKRYWLCVLFWGFIGIGIQGVVSNVIDIWNQPDVVVVHAISEDYIPLKPYVPPVAKVVKKKVPVITASPNKASKYFSRGTIVERKGVSKYKYSENDIILLASILEAECPHESDLPDWDRRIEANVILNRHNKHGGTLKSIIEAGNGTQFNGIRTKTYKNRRYSKESYDAAYAVLILGQRVIPDDCRYFANTALSSDKRFINSIDWVLVQGNNNGNSVGRSN